ncbi:MAG: ATP-binding cassette domain-containing protein [Candidatus Izemoplasmatales bacterium]
MIEVRELHKDFVKYERKPSLIGSIKSFFNAKKVITKAVDGVSFTIREGEIVGYIGPNGAGKSTTIKMLAGILTPTSGSVVVDGVVPYKERIRNAFNIGVVFGQRTQLWWDLPLNESFTILKEIYNVSDADFKERMAFFNDILEINAFIKSPVRTLSLGQRMRADIAAALLHHPKILFLDEPTIGLDVVAKQKMRDAIRHMNRTFHTTVILTTHDLDDIEELCSRIIMIDKGKIMYEGSLDEIKDIYGYMKTVKFECAEAVELPDLAPFGLSAENLSAEADFKTLKIRFNKHLLNVSEITGFVMQRYKVLDMSVSEPPIETLVANIYEKGEVVA